MSIRRFLYKFAPFIQGNKIVDATYVEVDNAELPLLSDTSQASFASLQNQISNLIVPTPQAFRAFRVFSGGTLISNVNFRIERITLTDINIETWNNINSIYSAQRVDKNVEILLPTDSEINISPQGFPVTIEITHLGGTSRLNERNLVIPQLKAGDTSSIQTVALGNQRTTTIQQGDVVVLTKSAAGQNWVESRATHVSGQALLPSGVFDLQVERMIQDITNIATELNGVSISAGDAFEVVTGGTYFGEEIRSRDVIVALSDNPNLTTNSEDWLIISNGSGVLTQDQIAFFNNVSRSGTRFDLSRNITVDSSNVVTSVNMASGSPYSTSYHLASQVATQQTLQFTDSALQFSDLVGGQLSIMVSFGTSSSSGFPPELVDLKLIYGSTEFTFPLSNSINVDGGIYRVDITIPNQDYSAILNTNPTINLTVGFRGVSYIGTFTINALMNTVVGNLHNPIVSIAQTEADKVRAELEGELDTIRGSISDEQASFSAINNRISPFRTEIIEEPYVFALFLDDATGSDPAPALSSMSAVNSVNPVFAVAGTSVFIAVEPSTYSVRNITQSTEFPLDTSLPNVSVLASNTLNNRTYFLYRVTGFTANDVIEVEATTPQEVVAWQRDIDNLQEDINRIDTELTHALLNLDEEVVQVLENEVTVTEESTPNVVPTDYNRQLAGPSNATQTVFYESTPNAASGGIINSKPINENNSNDRYRNKLIYLPQGSVYPNGTIISANDTVNTPLPLITHNNGNLFAKQFVAATPGGSSVQTYYPAPASRVSGSGIWQTIETLTFRNGVPVPEADELFFTRNIPSQATTLTIQYRGHANGNVFGSSSTTLDNVGGNQEVATSFNISDGSETATIEVRYSPNYQGQGHEIRVSVTERVNTGLPTINDVQVILSYQQTVTTPATPATTRDVNLGTVTSLTDQVFAIKADGSGNLIIVSQDREVPTNYPYTTLFGATEVGFLVSNIDTATYLDYEDFTPINTTVVDLQNHSDLPQFGLFTTEYTHATVVNLDTQLTIKNSQGDTVNVGEELIMISPDNSRWRLSIDNLGVLIRTKLI